jgi:hypothetical protein
MGAQRHSPPRHFLTDRAKANDAHRAADHTPQGLMPPLRRAAHRAASRSLARR